MKGGSRAIALKYPVIYYHYSAFFTAVPQGSLSCYAIHLQGAELRKVKTKTDATLISYSPVALCFSDHCTDSSA